ncbi:MAG: hypothetical protein AAF720_11635 [Pseudomonadota bacterium]
MTNLKSLTTFDDWKHCITEACGIPLTHSFVEQRLAALRDPSDYGTKKFVETWGEDHLQRVIGWFEQAEREYRSS